MILVPMERYECLVSRTLKNSKIQRSDQKLWPRKVSLRAHHDFQNISTVLTSISTHE